jgi:hypothetical protein
LGDGPVIAIYIQGVLRLGDFRPSQLWRVAFGLHNP